MVNGTFDENTSIAPSQFRTTSTTVYAGLLDEYTLSTTPGGAVTITYSLGTAGTGGTGAQSGSAGTATTVTVTGGIGATMTANGGSGGIYNTGASAAGGTASATNLTKASATGGTGGGAVGDLGGGGGGAINGVNGPGPTLAGGTGATPTDFSGLSSALTGSGYSLGTGGAGSPGGDPGTANINNGSPGTGIGAGGGGAGYYGGAGGAGSYGGGGGGAAGYSAILSGGTGGQGVVILQLDSNPAVVLTSGTSYTVSAGTYTTLKIWAIGAGGGGAGVSASDGTAGGAGGAGGISYILYSNLAAQRQLNDGTLQVGNIFDEFTGAPVVDTSLILWYDAGQSTSYPGTGTTITDLSATNNTGTLRPSIGYNSIGSWVYTLNSTQYISVANSTPYQFLNTSPYTFDMWAKVTAYPADATYNRFWNRDTNPGSGRDGFNFYIDGAVDGTTIQFYSERWVAGTGIGAGVNVTYSTVANTWIHWVVTYDGTNVRLYRNGVLSATSAATTGNITNTTALLYIGGQGGSGNPSMETSGLKIYNRVLTADEITTNFNALRGRYGI